MKKIVVTGGCGFIGSQFVNTYRERFPKSKIIVVDKFGYGSDQSNITASGVKIIQWDLQNGMPDLPAHVDAVFHFAAESHVDRSIHDPTPFVKNNIDAMMSVLEYVREHPRTQLVNVSTDEVYGAIEDAEDYTRWTEDSPVLPNSPYSASKASCDLLCRAYIQTYGLNIITTRCTNNIGINQYDEKLIPTVVRCIVHGIPIPIYGAGDNIREWIPVQNHIDAILKIVESETRGIYNIGYGLELNNLALVDMIRHICRDNGYISEIEFVEDRKGHDFKYAIDTLYREYATEVKVDDFNKYLTEVVKFYITKYESDQTQI